MNRTEVRARAWLERQGIRGLTFHSAKSPDFVGADGSGYEVKLIQQNDITFSTRQMQQLAEQGNVTVLVFTKDGDEPVASFPFSEIRSFGSWRRIHLRIVHYLSKKLYDELLRLGEDPGQFVEMATARALEKLREVPPGVPKSLRQFWKKKCQ